MSNVLFNGQKKQKICDHSATGKLTYSQTTKFPKSGEDKYCTAAKQQNSSASPWESSAAKRRHYL